MMHHLPDDLKCRGLAEIVRVLKPEGRLLVLDLKGHAGPWKSSIQNLPALMKEAGFSQIEVDKTRFSISPELSFVRVDLTQSIYILFALMNPHFVPLSAERKIYDFHGETFSP